MCFMGKICQMNKNKCLCGCGKYVNAGKKYVSVSHYARGRSPHNTKYDQFPRCFNCKNKFKLKSGKPRKYCSVVCYAESKKGKEPWNKGHIGLKPWHNITGLLKGAWNKGLTKESDKRVRKWAKSCAIARKNAHIKPWNYIDGRSKTETPRRYGDDWNIIRHRIYKRDGYRCQKCMINMNEHIKKYKMLLHVHHIIPFLDTRDNTSRNLVTLCKSCHVKTEAKLIKMKKTMYEEINND